MNDVLFIIDDKNFNIVDVNRKTYEMFGYTYNENLKLKLGDLCCKKGPYLGDVVSQNLYEAREKGYKIFEWLAKKKNGEFFFCRVFHKICKDNRF